MTLARSEERQLGKALRGLGAQAGAERLQLAGDPLRRGGLEQVRVVFEGGIEAGAEVDDVERELELRRRRATVESAERELGQRGEAGLRRALERECRLEEGRAVRAPFRLELLHQLL